MKQEALRSLDRILARMERRARRPRWRFSTAPIVLALGLVTADVLLAWLVPMIWDSILPHGLDEARTLRGWPALVWRGAVFCHYRQPMVQGAVAVVSVTALLIGSRSRPLRWLVWLCAAGVILLNAGILVVTINTGLRATAAAAGVDLN
jgi:hypothetical protein